MQLNFLFNGFILSYYMREKLDFKYWKLKSLNLSSIFFSGYRIQYPYQYARLTVSGIERLCRKTCSD